MARTIEFAVWPEDRKVVVYKRYAEVVGGAINICKDSELIEKLNECKKLGLELIEIFSGKQGIPISDSQLLFSIVDELDVLAMWFEDVSDKCQDADPSLSFCLMWVNKEASDLTFYYHCPEKPD